VEALKRVDIALPTFDDEVAMWGDASPQATIERLRAFGIGEIVVKNGGQGVTVFAGGEVEHVPVLQPCQKPVDTTAAGDSFNAAYLAARISGAPPVEAVRAGHSLAGEVIRHRGAIMPRVGAH
jgi:2-dehydro-3-deoxygluconokinase